VLEASPRAMAEATRRARLIRGYLLGEEPTRDVPRSTLWRWRAAFRAAEEAYGNGFVGLIPRIHAAPTRQRD
jgi:hypothetical protein